MNKGDLRAHFKETLNRDDCSDDLADMFISQGLSRVERRLRSQSQRTLWTITVDSEDFDGYLNVPNDYLSMDWIKVNDVSLSRISPTRSKDDDKLGPNAFGWATYYIENAKIYFRPEIADGDIIKVNYYSTFDRGDSDSDITAATLIIPDVVMYAALISAGVYFLDERLETFKMMYAELLEEVQEQISLDETSGGAVVSNPYEGYI